MGSGTRCWVGEVEASRLRGAVAYFPFETSANVLLSNAGAPGLIPARSAKRPDIPGVGGAALIEVAIQNSAAPTAPARL